MKHLARVAGIEIGGAKIQVAAGTPAGVILEIRRYAVSPERGAKGIQEQILDGLKSLRLVQPFEAIGIGFGGAIDWQMRRIIKSIHIKGWEDFAVGDWLQSEFKVPVFTDNDANVAALGEAGAGGGRGKDPVFYMTVGTGVGGGIVQGGRIYHGRRPGEVEIGHTRIPFPDLRPRDWPILEALCSGRSLDQRIRKVIADHPRSVLAGLARRRGGGKEARYLLKACRLRDPHAKLIWDDLCRYLALGLSHIVHLFHPEILIIGGGVSLLGPPLLRDLRKRVGEIVLPFYRGTYGIRLAELGENAVPAGALLLAGQGASAAGGEAGTGSGDGRAVTVPA